MSHTGGMISTAASRLSSRIMESSRFSLLAGHPGKLGHSPQSLIVQTGPGPQWSPGGHARSDAGVLAPIAASPSTEIAAGEAMAPKVVLLTVESKFQLKETFLPQASSTTSTRPVTENCILESRTVVMKSEVVLIMMQSCG